MGTARGDWCRQGHGGAGKNHRHGRARRLARVGAETLMKHALGQRLCGGVAMALVVGVGLAMARSFRAAVAGVGWYGEIVPAGVRKGTVPGEYLHAKDQAVMVYVPAGVFIRGTSAGQAQELAAQFGEYFAVETPQRSIDLDAYYVDKFEVTNHQYAQFLTVFASTG